MRVRRSIAAVGAALALTVSPAAAHNNPQFEETLLLTVPVAEAPVAADVYSETFSLPTPEEGTVGLVWRVRDGDDAVRFQVARDGEPESLRLNDGKMTGVMSGSGYAVIAVTGTDGPFVLEIYAASRR